MKFVHPRHPSGKVMLGENDRGTSASKAVAAHLRGFRDD
jgi:hypothetical protein